MRELHAAEGEEHRGENRKDRATLLQAEEAGHASGTGCAEGCVGLLGALDESEKEAYCADDGYCKGCPGCPDFVEPVIPWGQMCEQAGCRNYQDPDAGNQQPPDTATKCSQPLFGCNAVCPECANMTSGAAPEPEISTCPQPSGIAQAGNSCWMASLLQIIMLTPEVLKNALKTAHVFTTVQTEYVSACKSSDSIASGKTSEIRKEILRLTDDIEPECNERDSIEVLQKFASMGLNKGILLDEFPIRQYEPSQSHSITGDIALVYYVRENQPWQHQNRVGNISLELETTNWKVQGSQATATFQLESFTAYGGNHYWAYAKFKDKWFELDDASVSEFHDSVFDVFTQYARLAVFRKKPNDS